MWSGISCTLWFLCKVSKSLISVQTKMETQEEGGAGSEKRGSPKKKVSAALIVVNSEYKKRKPLSNTGQDGAMMKKMLTAYECDKVTNAKDIEYKVDIFI